MHCLINLIEPVGTRVTEHQLGTYRIYKTAMKCHTNCITTIFTKRGGLPDKTGKFSFCPAKTFSMSDKRPVNSGKESLILTTKMPLVLQTFADTYFVLQKISVCLPAVLHQKKKKLQRLHNTDHISKAR